MQNWYTMVSNDIGRVPDFITYYECRLREAAATVRIHGLVEKNIAALPGLTEQTFNELQTIEAVLTFLNIQVRKVRSDTFKRFFERYNKELSARECDKYVDGEDAVINLELVVNSVALIRNQYLGVIKGLEQKGFGLGHIVRLRTAGMELTEVG